MNDQTSPPADGLFATASRFMRGWNRFWFRPADPAPLALVRICCGIVLLYVYLSYTTDLQEFFGADAWIDQGLYTQFRNEMPFRGASTEWIEPPPAAARAETPVEEQYWRTWKIHPRQVDAQGWYLWSIWCHVTDPIWMKVIHGGLLIVLFFMTIGFCTRTMTVLAWLGALSYPQRSMNSVFGMDAIMSFVLLYLIIGPSGAAFSVDRLIGRYVVAWRRFRERYRSRKSIANAAAPSLKDAERPAGLVSANLALRLLQIHLCIVYLASGTSKLQGNAWWNGTAVWSTLVNFEFSPLRYSHYLWCIREMCRHRWFWELFITGGVAFTLIFEIGFISMVWNRRLRWFMILGAVMLHAGIATFMGLTTFSAIMVTAVISFVPAPAARKFVDSIGQAADGLRLHFNCRSRRQVRAASLIHAFDPWEQIALAEYPLSQRPVNDHEETQLQLVTHEGEILTGYPLFVRVVRSLRILWPVALFTWIPGVAQAAKTWFPPAPRDSGATHGEPLSLTKKKQPAEQHS